MNNVPVQPKQREIEDCDPFMKTVGSLGMALFILGIFVPGAHTMMMVGLALISISYIL
jgi:hypothetical protein